MLKDEIVAYLNEAVTEAEVGKVLRASSFFLFLRRIAGFVAGRDN